MFTVWELQITDVLGTSLYDGVDGVQLAEVYLFGENGQELIIASAAALIHPGQLPSIETLVMVTVFWFLSQFLMFLLIFFAKS